MDKRRNAKISAVPAPGTAGDAIDLKARLIKIIAAAGLDEVSAMLDRLWSVGGFQVHHSPRVGLIMITIRDPFETPFHFGEVLVSEAQVLFEGHAGYGVTCGDEPERALLLAAVESAELSGRSSLLGEIGDFIDRLEKKCTEQTKSFSKLAAATAVRFESMKKETVDLGSLGE